ncbi:MAG: hypothetical protein HYW06_12195 [Gemmatimonadetes bacterium]|nr:hypothetical protein [Gemmatimonadota bacterium]MBI2537695.1 hypothetical protein [Gemmatimonadota bacterium]
MPKRYAVLAAVAFVLFTVLATAYAPVASALVASATLILVAVTWQYTRLTSQSLALLREARLAEFQPLAALTLNSYMGPGAHATLAIELRNIGRGPAIRLAPILHRREFHTTSDWILVERSETIPGVLALGETVAIKYPLETGVATDARLVPPQELRVTVRYEDTLRNLYFLRAEFVAEKVGHPLLLREAAWRRPSKKRTGVFESAEMLDGDDSLFLLDRPYPGAPA